MQGDAGNAVNLVGAADRDAPPGIERRHLDSERSCQGRGASRNLDHALNGRVIHAPHYRQCLAERNRQMLGAAARRVGRKKISPLSIAY